MGSNVAFWSPSVGDRVLNAGLLKQIGNNPAAAALTTVGAGTITAAIANSGGVIRGGTQTAAFTDTTATALLLIAGVSSLASNDGSSFDLTYVNNTVFPATIAGGVGVTVSGVTVVPANSWVTYLVTRTTSTTVTMVATSQGYFQKSGTFTANGATPVTVTDARITAGSTVAITLKTVGGTVGAVPAIQTITAGIGFTVAGTASDTSVYNYEIRG